MAAREASFFAGAPRFELLRPMALHGRQRWQRWEYAGDGALDDVWRVWLWQQAEGKTLWQRVLQVPKSIA